MLGWAGMRGVVTLAAAFVIPEDTPHREVLLLMAFTVVAGTLFIQGMSLPWLARRLRVPGPDPAEDALARATLLQQASKAALHRLDDLEYDDPQGVVDLIRQRLDQRNFAAWERLGTVADQESPSDLYARIRLAMLEAERERVLEIRRRRHASPPRWSPTCWRCSTSRSRCSTSPPRSAAMPARPRRSGVPAAAATTSTRYPAVETVDATGLPATASTRAYHWVSLRQCLECGNVGCCDSSVAQHATKHFHDTTHPVMESAEPGEDWRWCFVHHKTA